MRVEPRVFLPASCTYVQEAVFVNYHMEETNMYLYNSLSHKKELFVPNNPDLVKMYTCGPTVYHYAHIGNLRTYIMEDVLEKALRYVGYNVKRVMNITDVGHLSGDSDDGEDKMLFERLITLLLIRSSNTVIICSVCHNNSINIISINKIFYKFTKF